MDSLKPSLLIELDTKVKGSIENATCSYFHPLDVGPRKHIANPQPSDVGPRKDIENPAVLPADDESQLKSKFSAAACLGVPHNKCNNLLGWVYIGPPPPFWNTTMQLHYCHLLHPCNANTICENASLPAHSITRSMVLSGSVVLYPQRSPCD